MTAILYSGSGDARLTATLAHELRLALADRFSLWGHPAFHYAGNAAATGSTIIKVPIRGTRRMAEVLENASVSTSADQLSAATVTIARQALRYDISDLANLTDAAGHNTEALVVEMVGAAAERWMEMVCTSGATFSESVGTTGTAMNVDTFLDATYAARLQRATGQIAVLAPEAVNELIEDMRGETGPLAMRADAQDLFTARSTGIAYEFAGVPIVVSDFVATSAGDRIGFLTGAGGIAWADGTPRAIRGGSEVVFPAGQQLYVELTRDAAGALTSIVGNYFVGTSLLEDEQGVAIVSVASA